MGVPKRNTKKNASSHHDQRQNVIVVRPDGQGDMVHPDDSGHELLRRSSGEPAGGDFLGFEGKIGIRYNEDGTETHVLDGHLRAHRTEPSAEHHSNNPSANYDPRIDGSFNIRRLLIGAVLTSVVLMIMADVLGVPHVRTQPGIYVSLDGEKQTDDTDAPLVILKRLDRSVFAYAIDAVGWAFSEASKAIAGKNPDPEQITAN